MKNVRKIVMVIIGTLIGAGFASGREILIFFSNYGKYGLLGIIITGIITAFIFPTNIVINATINIPIFLILFII